MKARVRLWAGILVLNMAIAGAVALFAPSQVGTTADRVGYEYVAQHPLEPNCPYSIFCYRVLVPTLMSHVGLPEVLAWRGFAVVANGLTGALLAGVAAASGGAWLTAVYASMLYQTSFGATFAVFDPFTPDAAVYLICALLALCYVREWPLVGLVVALVGVFAKETVALVATCVALAATLGRSRSVSLVTAVVPWLLVVGFHFVMDAFAGWSERDSPSADLLGGSWLARWLADSTLTSSARGLYLFIPFGFAWVYALFGFPNASPRLRWLALGALLLLVLVYVQTPERALATASFVVVPLAAIFLSRLPGPVALAAVLTNGLLTARVGLSTALLPPLPYLLILAGSLAVVAIVRDRVVGSRAPSMLAIGSSRVASSR